MLSIQRPGCDNDATLGCLTERCVTQMAQNDIGDYAMH